MKDQSRAKQTLTKKKASLDEAGEYAENIINTVREPLIILDQELRVVTASRSFYEYFKVNPDETEGQLIYNLGNEQWDIPKLRELLETILPQKTTFDNYEVEHNFTSIGKRIMLLNARQIKRALGKERLILLAIEDITDRKQLENLLIDSEERYRHLFETASDGIVFLEQREGRITHANPACEKTLGYTKKELIGNKLQDIGVSLDISDFQTTMQNLNRNGFINYSDVPVKTKSGQQMDADIYLVDRATLVQCTIRDITERKRIEMALRESEKKYRDLYDFLPIPVYEMDFEANIISANRAVYETFRGTKEDLKKGITGWQLLSPDDVAKSAKNIERLLKGEQIGGTEYALMRLDGSVFPAIVISSVIYSDGKPVGLRGAIIDITEHKQQADEMYRTNTLLNSIIENIPDMIFLKDAKEFRFVRFNRAGEHLLGYSREELLGKSDYNFFSKEQADLFTKTDQKVMSGKAVVDIAQESIQTLYKGERILHTKKVPILNANGEPEYLLGISEDITESKRAEEGLKKSESKYRLLADNVEDVIFVLDMNLRFTYVSPSVKILMGYEKEELLTLPASEVMTPTSWDLAARNLSEIMELEKAGTSELSQSQIVQLKMRRKDGSTVWTEVKASFVRDENHRPVGIIGVGRDITERMRVEKELYQTLDNLRKSFAATVQVMVSATEMRDPYTAGHQLRVADLACTIATEMGLPKHKVEGIRMAGSIHDIGKLSIPTEILSKSTKLTNNEYSLIKEHSQSGYEMLKNVESPWPLAEIVYQHHERMNGSGYPRQLKGDEIIMEARIMAVADVVEAMASYRPYRAALGIEVALEEIEKNKGIIYDADVADACLRLFRKKGYQLK